MTPDATALDEAHLLGTIATLQHELEVVQEGMADLELAADNQGWQSMAFSLEQELSRSGLTNVTRNCRVMVIASPLIKRGMQLRIGYVWGQGVTVQARDEDLNQVIQAWWDDESNQAALTSSQAQEELERAQGTDGQVFIACFADPLTGRVQHRSTPFEEIVDIVKNPDDRDDPWFYLRSFTVTVIEQGYSGLTRRRQETRRVFHPALGFWPKSRPKSIDGIPVAWDTPILHVPVNRLDGATWGVPDVYASIPWARAYDGFLTDWARLVKALSKFAWRLTGDRSTKVRTAAARLASLVPADLPQPGGSTAGGVAAMGPGANLEAIPKSGATIDSQSGKPLASMVAAGMGVPVTMLLADPGTTGARAVAETLDKPTILEMGMRRELWSSVLQKLAGYVILQAVKAPRGPLRGTITQAGNTQQVTLTGDVEPTVVVEWPDLNELDPVQFIQAIASADSTGLMPPLETLRLLLTALKVDDVDEVLESVTDENGEFVDPRIEAAAAAVEAHRRRIAA